VGHAIWKMPAEATAGGGLRSALCAAAALDFCAPKSNAATPVRITNATLLQGTGGARNLAEWRWVRSAATRAFSSSSAAKRAFAAFARSNQRRVFSSPARALSPRSPSSFLISETAPRHRPLPENIKIMERDALGVRRGEGRELCTRVCAAPEAGRRARVMNARCVVVSVRPSVGGGVAEPARSATNGKQRHARIIEGGNCN